MPEASSSCATPWAGNRVMPRCSIDPATYLNACDHLQQRLAILAAPAKTKACPALPIGLALSSRNS